MAGKEEQNVARYLLELVREELVKFSKTKDNKYLMMDTFIEATRPYMHDYGDRIAIYAGRNNNRLGTEIITYSFFQGRWQAMMCVLTDQYTFPQLGTGRISIMSVDLTNEDDIRLNIKRSIKDNIKYEHN